MIKSVNEEVEKLAQKDTLKVQYLVWSYKTESTWLPWALGSALAPHKLGLVAQACNPSTLEAGMESLSPGPARLTR